MTLEEYKALEEKWGKLDSWMLWGPTMNPEPKDPFEGEEFEELTEEERDEIYGVLEDDEDDEEETIKKSRLDLPADGHLPESPKDDDDEWDGEPRDDVETM